MGKENEKNKKMLRKTQALIMLEQGMMPKKTKLGTEFKGKNLVIVCKGRERRKSR